ncbi:unnamed protein product [Linum trigynum]|uniref:Uncharacterized protein n=1 Tax=Linum trigynum TaxID=586398 RepID=A0AAV2F6L1_9ROSI
MELLLGSSGSHPTLFSTASSFESSAARRVAHSRSKLCQEIHVPLKGDMFLFVDIADHSRRRDDPPPQRC